MPPGPADVYLHIGLPKTGTTYLQHVLWASRGRLGTAGVLVPGQAKMDQSFAVWDLLGRRARDGEQPGVAGSWGALVAAARSWSGSTVVVSEELLAAANPRQASRAVRAFAPARVRVVVTVRDLARVVVAAWQQELVKGRSWTLDEFAASVRDPAESATTAGISFWLRQDVARVLDVWEQAVPRADVRLVTLPPAGSGQGLLLDRFCAATDLPRDRVDDAQDAANESVGAAEAEVLRRLNERLAGKLNERQHVRVVKRVVQPALQARGAERIGFPAEHQQWLLDTARGTVEALLGRGYRVEGDLDDLVPAGLPPASAERGQGDLGEAALDALAAVSGQFAETWWRGRRKERVAGSSGPRRLASTGRAGMYRARLAVLGLGGRSRVVRRLIARRVRRQPQSTGPPRSRTSPSVPTKRHE